MLTIVLLIGITGCGTDTTSESQKARVETTIVENQSQMPNTQGAPPAPRKDWRDNPYYYFPPKAPACYLDGELTVDLNGDGREDTIRYFLNNDGGVIIKVNELSINLGEIEEYEKFVQVIDLDTSDPYKEIAVFDAGPSSDPCFTSVWYNGSNLSRCGQVPGGWEGLKFHGDGRLTSSGFRGAILCTWWYEATLVLDSEHMLIVLPELRRMIGYSNREDDRLAVTAPFALRKLPKDDSPIVTVLKPGDTILLMVTDDAKWIQAETSKGLRGWFAVENYSHVVGLTPNQPGGLEGMNCAD